MILPITTKVLLKIGSYCFTTNSYSQVSTLRGLNFADFADLGKNTKLSDGEKFATGHPRN